jgi:hypothetical protein
VPDNDSVLARAPAADGHAADADGAVVRVSLVDIAEKLRPRRDRLSWFVSGGSLLIAALSAVVAIIAVTVQEQGNRNAQAAVSTADAYKVSISSLQGDQFSITNLAQASITDVWLRPAARGYDSIGTVGSCTKITVTLPGARTPVLYFTDDHGNSWELAYGGQLHPGPDPAAILDYLPLGSQIAPAGSSLAELGITTTHNMPDCS